MAHNFSSSFSSTVSTADCKASKSAGIGGVSANRASADAKNLPNGFARLRILIRSVQLRQHIAANQRLRMRRKNAARRRFSSHPPRCRTNAVASPAAPAFSNSRRSRRSARRACRRRTISGCASKKRSAAIPLPQREESDHRHQLHADEPAAGLQRFQAGHGFPGVRCQAAQLRRRGGFGFRFGDGQLHGQTFADHVTGSGGMVQVHIFAVAGSK